MNKSQSRDLTPVVPRKLRTPFLVLVVCFALWGILNDMTNSLVPAFEKIFTIKPTDSAGVQIAFYGAYAVLAIFAAMIIEEFSYRVGLLVALALYSLGALFYIPACMAGSFDLYLLGIFILASGLSILETTCNPYILSMGPAKTAVRRLNFAQAFNPIGSVAGIMLAKFFILSNLNEADVATRTAMKASDPDKLSEIIQGELFWVCVPYIALIGVAAAVWIYFFRHKAQVTSEADTGKPQRSLAAKIKLIVLYLLCIAVPVAILVGVNGGENPPALFQAREFQLVFILLGPIAFMLIISSYRTLLGQLMRIPRYYLGVIAQFFYVGIQIGTWTWLIKYSQKELGLNEESALMFCLISMVCFMVGRWGATYFMRKYNPASMMSLFATGGILCCLGGLYLPNDVLFSLGGLPFSANVLSLVISSAFMSLMFPTIYGIALGGLNEEQRKLGSAGLIIAILGGALITAWMAHVAQTNDNMFACIMPSCIDNELNTNLSCSSLSVRCAFAIPAISYAVILIYSLIFNKPVIQDEK